jgi:hypothetical protein
VETDLNIYFCVKRLLGPEVDIRYVFEVQIVNESYVKRLKRRFLGGIST